MRDALLMLRLRSATFVVQRQRRRQQRRPDRSPWQNLAAVRCSVYVRGCLSLIRQFGSCVVFALQGSFEVRVSEKNHLYVCKQIGFLFLIIKSTKIMAADVNGDELNVKQLIEHIRSEDETERRITISQIPSLVLKSLRNNVKIIDQLLLVIYNLNTEMDNYELLNAGNSTLIIRHLLRLYVNTIQEEKHELCQIDSLIGLIDLVHSSDLLVEIAYVLYRCSQSLEEGDETMAAIDQALGVIEDRATASLHPEALLMIHSIKAMR